MLMKLKDTPIEVPNQGGGLEDEDEVTENLLQLLVLQLC